MHRRSFFASLGAFAAVAATNAVFGSSVRTHGPYSMTRLSWGGAAILTAEELKNIQYLNGLLAADQVPWNELEYEFSRSHNGIFVSVIPRQCSPAEVEVYYRNRRAPQAVSRDILMRKFDFASAEEIAERMHG